MTKASSGARLHKGKRFRLLVGAALLALTAACVIVPIGLFNESPYSPEVLEKIPKGSTKLSVRQVLGPPKSEQDGGRYWFYFNRRDTVGVIGSPSGVIWGEFEWLLVEFDGAGRVAFIERNEFGQCASNGVCMDGAAPPAQDQKARTYALQPGECGLYLYLEALPWPLTTGVAKFRVDGRALGTVNAKTFLFVARPAGEVTVAAYDLRIATHCEAGTRVYVRAVKKKDMSWETGEDLAPVTAAEGEPAVRARKLAMPD